MPVDQPDQYCLLWINWWATCLSKNEWASWVQAIGTLATLGVAALVVRYEIKQRRIDATQQEATGLTARLHLVVFLTAQLENFIERTKPEEVLSTAAYTHHFSSLRAACKRVGNIDLIELPTQESMFSFGAIHQDVATLELTLSMLEHSRPLRNEHEVLTQLLVRIENHVKALARETQRLRMGFRE